MIERVAKLYRADDEQRCPGEADCNDFQRSAPPKCQACEGCPLKDTKPSVWNDEGEAVVAAVERLARERRAGKPVLPSSVDALTWELLLVWDEAVAAHERAHQARITALVEALATRG